MATNKIKVNTRPVAETYSRPGERIVEFSSPHGGGLLSFRLDDGRLIVEVYREDDTVVVLSAPRHHTTTVPPAASP